MRGKSKLRGRTYYTRPLSWSEELRPRYPNLSVCWNCNSHAIDRLGYIRFQIYAVTVFAHRFVYEECFGAIPDGLVVRHKCDNPSCINPEHLELGTQRDNAADCIKRNRKPVLRGEANPASKINPETVRLIRAEAGKQRDIGKKYGLSQTTVRRIKSRIIWKHVE